MTTFRTSRDGGNYPNESVLAEVEPPRKVVVQHESKPEYRLTITIGGRLTSRNPEGVSPMDVAEHLISLARAALDRRVTLVCRGHG
jgi:hypothetical protein